MRGKDRVSMATGLTCVHVALMVRTLVSHTALMAHIAPMVHVALAAYIAHWNAPRHTRSARTRTHLTKCADTSTPHTPTTMAQNTSNTRHPHHGTHLFCTKTL